MFDFTSKSLLLYGATGGIGRQIARQFRDAGARVFLVDRDETLLAEFAASLGATDSVAYQSVEMTDPAAVKAATDRAAATFGAIDYMVNSAGLYTGAAVADMDDQDWKLSIGVNLDAVFYASRAVIPHMPEGGAIVNIASLSGHRGDRNHAHYAAAKAGVLGFSKTLALEVAPRLRVNAISPGVIETPMALKQIAGERDRIIATTPLKRFGTPGDIANAVAFLCSDASSFITGEVLHVNGGYFIAG